MSGRRHPDHICNQNLIDARLDVQRTARRKERARQKCLYSSARQGNSRTVLWLLRDGVDVNGKYRGGSALEGAAQKGHQSLVELLLEWGADPNQTGGQHGSPLHAAIVEHHEEIAATLLEAGANPNIQDGNGRSALKAAIETGDEAVVLCFYAAQRDDAGADIDATGGLFGSVPLAAIEETHSETVRKPSKRGAEVVSEALAAASNRGDTGITIIEGAQFANHTKAT